MSDRSPAWVAALFRGLGSSWVLGLSTTLTTAWVLAAARFPQDWWAEALLESDRHASLRAWAAWGLTHGFEAPWFWAAVSLTFGAMLANGWRERGLGPAQRVVLRSARPEVAPETVERAFRALAGRPRRLEVDGPLVRLHFDRRAPDFATNLGVLVIIVTGGAALTPPPPQDMVTRALLEVRDRRSGAAGLFDISQGETRSFFRDPRSYVLGAYVPDRNGLGPAVQIEIQDQESGRSEYFWVYEDAPTGFDGRHRRGSVAIEAESLSLVARPGRGLTTGPLPLLLILGMVLIGFGFLAAGTPEGDWLVEVDGPRVEVTARPVLGRESPFGPRTEALLEQLRAGL
ncbi:MAG: hypothetical protein AAGD10_15890 [Myxococcota bacterium]